MEVIIHQENINETAVRVLFILPQIGHIPSETGRNNSKSDGIVQDRTKSSEIGPKRPKSRGTVLNWRSHLKSDRDVEMFNVCKRSFVHALLTIHCC